jgi:hypothetical protein
MITPSGTGAANTVSGVVSTGSTWYEDIELVQDDAPMTGVDGYVWVMTFRADRDDAAFLTLSTTAGTLTILEDTSVTLLKIRCASTRLTDMVGDYFCDIRATDADTTIDGESRIIHYAHGVVSFISEPPVS